MRGSSTWKFLDGAFVSASGSEVDLATWLTVPPKALGLSLWTPQGQDCMDVNAEPFTFEVWPTPTGMAFQPNLPELISGCAREVVVPYARLRDKLTSVGQQAVADISGAK